MTKQQLKRQIITETRNYFFKLISENKAFNNWRMPSEAQLKAEFEYEHKNRGNHFWDSEESFFKAVAKGKVRTITPEMDANIDYRSGTQSKEELLNLIKRYRSYPQFRNEKTLDAIYDGFENNSPMDMPVIVDFGSWKRVFSGNTRMDVAFQLGINPKCLVIKADYEDF